MIKTVFEELDISEREVLRYCTDRGSNIIAALKSNEVQQPNFVRRVDASSNDPVIDIEIFFQSEESSDIEYEEFSEQDDEDELDLSDGEYAEFSSRQDEIIQNFPKQNFCVPHTLSLMSHVILDKKGSLVHKLKKEVLPLVKKFCSSGVASEKLKDLTGKKLLKISRTRWNFFTFVLMRLQECKEAVCSVAFERDFPIKFTWDAVNSCLGFLKPIATATTFLEGDKTFNGSFVLPTLLSLREHLVSFADRADVREYKQLSEKLLSEFDFRFQHILDPSCYNFNVIFLAVTMLNPQATMELTDYLFNEGKSRLLGFLKSEKLQFGGAGSLNSGNRDKSYCKPYFLIKLKFFSESNVWRESTEVSVREAAQSNQPGCSSQVIQRFPANPLFKRRRTLLPAQNIQAISPDSLFEKEVCQYLEILMAQTFNHTINPQEFWESNAALFPQLAPTALRYLAMPASSASAERLFSIAGYGSKGNKNNIAPPLLEAATLAKYNRYFVSL